MTTTTTGPAEGLTRRERPSGFGRLLGAEWTKLCSVRSTVWLLAAVVVTAIVFDILVTAVTMANWRTTSPSDKAVYLADPTGFLGPALLLAQVPLCVLGVMVIASEYSTGMIRSSVLAVPRRTPMLAAKAVVFAAVTFAVGEVVAFTSFLIGQQVIRRHIPVSLGDPAVTRAVVGMGLYIAVLGLLGLAIGGVIRHTGAAITVVVGVVVVLSNLARALPGSAGRHIAAYLPANAGIVITQAHQEASDLLSPWQGFAVLCLWTVLLLGAAAYLLRRRDV